MRFIVGVLIAIIIAMVLRGLFKTDFQAEWIPVGWCLVYFGERAANGDRHHKVTK